MEDLNGLKKELQDSANRICSTLEGLLIEAKITATADQLYLLKEAEAEVTKLRAKIAGTQEKQ